MWQHTHTCDRQYTHVTHIHTHVTHTHTDVTDTHTHVTHRIRQSANPGIPDPAIPESWNPRIPESGNPRIPESQNPRIPESWKSGNPRNPEFGNPRNLEKPGFPEFPESQNSPDVLRNCPGKALYRPLFMANHFANDRPSEGPRSGKKVQSSHGKWVHESRP